MATENPQPLPSIQPRSINDLIVRHADGDVLALEPLDLGPGAPGTAALETERGPEPSQRDVG